MYESAFQVDLENAKKEPVTVTVLEPISGDWEIVQKNHPFTRESAGVARFQVPVPAAGHRHPRLPRPGALVAGW